MNRRLLLSISLLLSTLVFGQQPNIEELDIYLNNAMAPYEQPGMAVGIIKDGEIVLQKGYGKANITTGEPVTETTLFQLASLSKAFTAAAIGMLVDDGELNWDDKVIDHLPSFRLYDAHISASFQVRDLLCHRNGYETFDGDLLWYGTNYTSEEMLQRFAKLPPKHTFREKYGYSNLNFIAAALLIEEKTDKTWAEFLTERIFRPLGMRSTSANLDDFLAEADIAHPHVKGKPIKHQNFDEGMGAVGVNSNVQDLLKWAQFWINKGSADGRQLLKEETWREIYSSHTPQTVSANNEASGTLFKSAGLGWMVSDQWGHKVAQHSGGLPGFILNLHIVPELNLGIVVLTNGESIIPFAATNYIFESYVHEEPENWMSKYLPYDQKRRENGGKTIELPKKSKAWLENGELIGEYEDDMYGEAAVIMKNGNPYLMLKPTELFQGQLDWLTKNTYRVRFNDPFLPDGKVTFHLDSDGAVSHFTIDLKNPDFNFYNLTFNKKKARGL